jgi:hypothetical protein
LHVFAATIKNLWDCYIVKFQNRTFIPKEIEKIYMYVEILNWTPPELALNFVNERHSLHELFHHIQIFQWAHKDLMKGV